MTQSNPNQPQSQPSAIEGDILDQIISQPRTQTEGNGPPTDKPKHPYRSEEQVRVPLELIKPEDRQVLEKRLSRNELREHVKQIRGTMKPRKTKKVCHCMDTHCNIGYFIEIEDKDA